MESIASSSRFHLATAGPGIKLWDGNISGEEFNLFSTCEVNHVSWDQQGSLLAASGCASAFVAVARVSGNSLLGGKHYRSPKSIHQLSVGLSPSGKLVAAGAVDSKIRLWDVKNQKTVLKTFSAEQASFRYGTNKRVGEVTCLEFSEGDSHIVSGSSTGVVALHNVTTGVSSYPLRTAPLPSSVSCVRHHRIRKSWVGVTCADGGVSYWDVVRGASVCAFPRAHSAPASALCFSPTNDMLALSVGVDKRVVLYDVRAKAVVQEVPLDGVLTSVDMLADGCRFCVGTAAGQVLQVDLRRLDSPLHTLQAYTGAGVNSLAVNECTPPKPASFRPERIPAGRVKSAGDVTTGGLTATSVTADDVTAGGIAAEDVTAASVTADDVTAGGITMGNVMSGGVTAGSVTSGGAADSQSLQHPQDLLAHDPQRPQSGAQLKKTIHDIMLNNNVNNNNSEVDTIAATRADTTLESNGNRVTETRGTRAEAGAPDRVPLVFKQPPAPAALGRTVGCPHNSPPYLSHQKDKSEASLEEPGARDPPPSADLQAGSERDLADSEGTTVPLQQVPVPEGAESSTEVAHAGGGSGVSALDTGSLATKMAPPMENREPGTSTPASSTGGGVGVTAEQLKVLLDDMRDDITEKVHLDIVKFQCSMIQQLYAAVRESENRFRRALREEVVPRIEALEEAVRVLQDRY